MSKKARAAIEAAAVFILVLALSFFDVFYSFDSDLRDKLYRAPRGIDNEIKIIAIDDRTLERLGPFGTWQRSVYADAVNAMGDYPAAVAMDIMFFGEMDESGDAALRELCAERDNIVCGSYINYSSVYKTDEKGKGYIDHMHIDSVSEPIVSDLCATGFVNAAPDEDGIVRSAFLTAEHDGRVYKSLSLSAYELYCERTGAEANSPRLDENGRMWIDYAGKPYDYEHISMCDLLDGKADPRIFSDCIVLIGAYAAGLRDQFSVPCSADQMYGVEIHANIIQSLLDGKMPTPAPRLLTAAIAAALSALAYFLSRLTGFRVSTAITVLLIGGFTVISILLDNGGVTIPFIYTPLFVLISYLFNLARRYIESAIEKRQLTAAFKKYVAPQVVEEIFRSGSYNIRLGGENRHIAVLFVDIRGFTPLSESLEPEQVVDILNSYLNLTTNAIFKNGGTLDKFIGDATMAVFNAPFDLDDYIYRAVCTAWDIVSGGNEIEHEFMEKYGKSVSFGVGVNCGNAVVGNIGCDFRMDYTAIGDTVNTAARLEANAKRGQILISSEVYESVRERITAEPVGEIPLKGKKKGVFVYSVTGVDRAE